MKIRTRTLLLIALAVVVAAQSLSLFLDMRRIDGDPDLPRELDFLLEVYGEPGVVEYQEGIRPELPQFEPKHDNWTISGQPLLEFANLVEGLEIGPHGSSPFLIIALPDDASVGDYHQALASLSWHGICSVGVYSPSSNREFVPVYRVLSVKLDNGATRQCIDRFPTWAPWAMNKE